MTPRRKITEDEMTVLREAIERRLSASPAAPASIKAYELSPTMRNLARALSGISVRPRSVEVA